MKTLKESKVILVLSWIFLTSSVFLTSQLSAQQLEVEGELKVTQLTVDDTQDNLVIHNTDGTLGSRSVASLPASPPPIDTTRNLASDFELAQHMCECGTSLPPFLVESLLQSGYTPEDLMAAGVPFSSLPFTCGDTIIDDRDGKTYSTLLIGGQCWMTENLNVGAMITGATSMSNNFVLEKYCYDDDLANCTIYGALYQWDEMMQYHTPAEVNQGVCPTNWHLPTDTEWKTLEMELGMTQAEADGTTFRGTDQGSQLAGNEALWTDGLLDQNGAFASSGFEALPGGRRLASGSFNNKSNDAFFWSTSGSASPWIRRLIYADPRVYRVGDLKSNGFSVRCVRD